jgi:2-iminobutanoate/2-iminopropanoate deaminase
MSMNKRQAIEMPGYPHGGNPIPVACRIGNTVATGGVAGVDIETGVMSADPALQCAHMFANLGRILRAAGTSPAGVIKMTVWVRDWSVREFLNKEWTATFPDPHSRPARHTMLNQNLPGSMQVQCEAWAIVDGRDEDPRRGEDSKRGEDAGNSGLP